MPQAKRNASEQVQNVGPKNDGGEFKNPVPGLPVTLEHEEDEQTWQAPDNVAQINIKGIAHAARGRQLQINP